MNCGQPVAARTTADETRLAQLAAATPAPLADKMRAAHIAGERKIVTALFADVVGSTALAEQMDPEEWTAIMNRAFERISPSIYRYEGTIARLMGDALLAFFGAPVAHEDDPARAIRAALDLLAASRDYAAEVRRAHGIDFAMRVGLNTGPVVVGSVGSDLKYEYTAMGDAINLAARMQSAADPDTVLIAERTYRLAAPLFEVEDRGRIEVKGKAEPVQVYRVIGPRQGVVQTRGIEGLRSPLVGRDHELDTLTARVEDVINGRGQIVSVMGEAGLGKSRLVAELRKLVLADPISNLQPPTSNLQWLEGRSLSYETNTPYAPFSVLLNSLFDLRAGEPNEARYEQLKARLAELAPGRETDLAPYLSGLFEITPTGEDIERVRYLEPPHIRQRLFQSTVELVEHLAQARPLVLAFEDLHWADPTSLELIEQLLPLTDRAPLLILALFRPRRQEPAWRFHESATRDYAHRYTSIALEPLDEDHSRALVANLLHIEDLPEKVRALILRKAEGNPFFVEEVIRSLLDAQMVVRSNGHWRATREIENIALPDTLVGVITARLDRLDEASKQVAQTAAVIGREFQVDVLKDVYEANRAVDPALGDLQRRELIRQDSRTALPAYLFKHVLTQEAAYGSILLSRRRELHRRVAECLERTAPERANDIARHFLEAQEPARALPYLVEAGDRAGRSSSAQEAMGYYRQALDILQKVENLPLARRAYEGLGRASTFANDMPGAVGAYQAMLSYAEARHDAPMRVSALNKMSMLMVWFGDIAQVNKNLSEAEQLAREVDDVAGLAETFTVRCNACLTAADFDGALKHLGSSVEVGRAANAKEPMLFGMAHMSNTLLYLTRFEEAWRTAEECRRLAEASGEQQYVAETMAFTIPFYHIRNGDFDEAQRIAEGGLKIATRIGHGMAEFDCRVMLGTIALLRGEHERALEHCQQMHQVALGLGLPLFDVIALGALGSAYLEISPAFMDQVREVHAQALELLESPLGVPGGAFAWADLGFCALALGEVNRASEFFQKGLTIPTMFMMLNRPRLLIGAALVALAQHQLDEAARLVNEARAYVEERAMKHLYPLVAMTDAQVSADCGETGRALEQYAQAESLAVSMQMRPIVWQARHSAAQLLSGLGRTAEAEAKRNGARTAIDEIAGLFEDQSLRERYLENMALKLDRFPS
ncbi:MAG TPA: adenylate/guanylate cyclase domain-containing protein [Anaerolineae bacterium]|nr:adenylate/guanylate cyclase domain-containing protein [Anaerolineae bacterium]